MCLESDAEQDLIRALLVVMVRHTLGPNALTGPGEDRSKGRFGRGLVSSISSHEFPRSASTAIA